MNSMNCSALSIAGYDTLGLQGKDGLRYAWKYRYGNALIESAAFTQRSTMSTENICGYTTSVSSGCVLKSFESQCVFCRTGNVLPFCGLLSYRDIAKQNIFMVLSDMYCEDHPELHHRPREFAYMGQGEPGFSYSQVRLAIELTNRAMNELGQTVHRHIFATCGVPEAVNAFTDDVQHFYSQRVTLHFSLHATKSRSLLMPINNRYPYHEVLYTIKDLHTIMGEKPCIGIMLFKEFQPKAGEFIYTNELEVIKQILSELDPEKHRLSFCEYNPSADICKSEKYNSEKAVEVLRYAQAKGFDAKLFSSFGQREQTACGMLGGKEPEHTASEKWKELEGQADDLIKQLT